MRIHNLLGWYTLEWVNRRSRNALLKGQEEKHSYYYRTSWERFLKTDAYRCQMEELGANPNQESCPEATITIVVNNFGE